MIKRVGLVIEDPKMTGQCVGKSKRIRDALSWVIKNDINAGDQLVALITRYERALYELGCAINGMRNKEGIGHGRPFCPNITKEEALSAVQSIGIIADYMLRKL